MHESKNDFGDGMALFGGEDLYYVPADELDDIINKFEAWKSYVFELLATQFGSDLRMENLCNYSCFKTETDIEPTHEEC